MMAIRPSRFHTCPIQGCIERVPNRHLMCGRHCSMVPAELRREHNANCRELRATGDDVKRGSAQRCIEAAGRR